MNERKIASRLVQGEVVAVRVARSYVGEFTEKVSFGLIPESGTASISLKNAEKIVDAGYEILKAVYKWTKDWSYELQVTFQRDSDVESWTFKGLSAVWGGEIPQKALIEFGAIFGMKLDPKKVMGESPSVVSGKKSGTCPLEQLM